MGKQESNILLSHLSINHAQNFGAWSTQPTCTLHRQQYLCPHNLPSQ